ncbi:hypothetical protein [Brevibacillus gelatini]
MPYLFHQGGIAVLLLLLFVDFPAHYPRAIREHVSVCEQARHQSGRAFRIILRYAAHRGLTGVLFAALTVVGFVYYK